MSIKKSVQKVSKKYFIRATYSYTYVYTYTKNGQYRVLSNILRKNVGCLIKCPKSVQNEIHKSFKINMIQFWTLFYRKLDEFVQKVSKKYFNTWLYVVKYQHDTVLDAVSKMLSNCPKYIFWTFPPPYKGGDVQM